MERAAKKLAEQLLEIYGPTFVEDRDLITDALADRGLDHDREDVDAVIRHADWLWEE